MRPSVRSGPQTAPAGIDVWLRGTGRDGTTPQGDGPAARAAAEHATRAAAAELATRAAAAALGRSAAGLRVAHDRDGRPCLTGAAAQLQVSLSHGRAATAAAVTMLGPVGVDIELRRPVDALALARRWFLPEEAAWLALLPDGLRSDAFLGLWTQKEAIAKALGTGLRGGVGLRQPVARIRRLPGLSALQSPGPSGMWLSAVPGGAGLAAVVARVTGEIVLAVACLGPAADGAAVRVRLVREAPPGQPEAGGLEAGPPASAAASRRPVR